MMNSTDKGLREAAEQRYVSPEEVANAGGGGGGRGAAVLYGAAAADSKMILQQHQAKNCTQIYSFKLICYIQCNYMFWHGNGFRVRAQLRIPGCTTQAQVSRCMAALVPVEFFARSCM